MEPESVPGTEGSVERWVSEAAVNLGEADRDRLAEMARTLLERGMPEPFVVAALQSTARTLEDLRRQDELPDEPINRDAVQRFIRENDATWPPVVTPPRREWKQLERERLASHTQAVLRDARRARARHEIKKTRSLLLKIDQRHLRRVLGSEGQDLCNQITGLLRSMSSKI